ncbi:Uncharacterized protein SCF082_LOCUS22747, partial [Durusdinium trenchii]
MDFSVLHSPYDSMMKTLLDTANGSGPFLRVKGRFCCSGVVMNSGLNYVTIALLTFISGVGFKQVAGFEKIVAIHIEGIGLRSFRLVPGSQIVCLGDPMAPCNGNEWFFTPQTVVIPRPELDNDLACNFIHAFSGAFSGWSQAASFLSKGDCGHCAGQQFYIDRDDTVMALWSVKHSSQVYSPPVAPQLIWNPSSHIGICAGIEDWTFLHLFANTANTVVSLSPPCPTWSKGGRSQGLNHANGWAFVEAIEMRVAVQANIVVAECVDEIMQHSHFVFIEALFKHFGFVRIFQQCTPHHHLANHMRTRWLATWIRGDIRPAFFDVKITPSITPRVAWHEQVYDFALPKIWIDQLVLDCDALKIYGNRDWLPPAKRSALPAQCTQVTISPTIPYEPLAEHDDTVCHELISISQADFDQVSNTTEFEIFLSALEAIVLSPGTGNVNIPVLCPDISITFTANIPSGAIEVFKNFIRSQAVGRQLSYRLIHDAQDSNVVQSVLLQQRREHPPTDVLSLIYEEGTTAPLLARRNFGRVSASTIYNIHHNPLAIATINGTPLTPGNVHRLADLDRIVLVPGLPVRAGGHHGYQGFPRTLQPGSSLVQRAEFSIETHGWLASDELFYITQMFDWASDHAVEFTPPVYWDVTSSDFDESPYGDIDVAFNQPTVIPILLQAHWGAIEILRKEDSLDLKLSQIPLHLHHSLVRIVGRRMEVGLNRITFQAEPERYIPHLCGWQLIYKWAKDLNLFDHIPDITGQFRVPAPETQDLIRMVVSAAMEDWRDAQAPPAIALFAAKLRRYFFFAVWTATEQGRPASEHMLLSAYPMHYIQPPDPPQPLPSSSATMRQVISERAQARFDHMHLHAGWLATDELNLFCDFARVMDPQILIAPASIWCPVRQTLVFPGTPAPEYRPFGHIIWPIIYKNHWLQIEVYKVQHPQSTHLMLTAPPAMHQSLNHIVNHILAALNIIPSSATITYFVQTTPPGMCGYALVKDMFDRMGISVADFAPQQQLLLTLSEHASRIATLQHDAYRVWNRSGANNDLIVFANKVRSAFLIKVINNEFPADYFAGGMEEVVMTPTFAPSAPSSAKPDPVWLNDPWKSYKPKQQQSRWEDLLLAEDHPFKGPDGKSVEQIHRLQASPWRGGIVLSTKSHLPDLLHLDPSNAVLA